MSEVGIFNFRGKAYPITKVTSSLLGTLSFALNKFDFDTVAEVICKACPGIEKSMLGEETKNGFIPDIEDEEFLEFSTKYAEVVARDQQTKGFSIENAKERIEKIQAESKVKAESAPFKGFGKPAAIGAATAAANGNIEKDEVELLRSRVLELEGRLETEKIEKSKLYDMIDS